MALQKIKKQSAEQLAADAVRQHILSGQIAPGERLTETFLAEKFSLSRATVRGAMQRMAQEGLLVLVPFTGWHVMSLSSHDAWELYTLRANLESFGARLAADCIDAEGADKLRAAYGDMQKAVEARDRNGVYAADLNLHRTIIALSAHSRLIQQYTFVEQQISLYIIWSDMLPEDDALYSAVIANHGPIVAAICERQGDVAAELSANHNVRAGLKLVAHLKQREAEQAAQAGNGGGSAARPEIARVS